MLNLSVFYSCFTAFAQDLPEGSGGSGAEVWCCADISWTMASTGDASEITLSRLTQWLGPKPEKTNHRNHYVFMSFHVDFHVFPRCLYRSVYHDPWLVQSNCSDFSCNILRYLMIAFARDFGCLGININIAKTVLNLHCTQMRIDPSRILMECDLKTSSWFL